MKAFLTRWAVNVIAIWVVFQFVPGVTPVATSLGALIVNGLILGLVNLTVLAEAFELIKTGHGKTLRLTEIPLDDQI